MTMDSAQQNQKKKGGKYNLRPRKQLRRRIVSDDGTDSSSDEDYDVNEVMDGEMDDGLNRSP